MPKTKKDLKLNMIMTRINGIARDFTPTSNEALLLGTFRDIVSSIKRRANGTLEPEGSAEKLTKEIMDLARDWDNLY